MQSRKQSWLNNGQTKWSWGTINKNKHQYWRLTLCKQFLFGSWCFYVFWMFSWEGGRGDNFLKSVYHKTFSRSDSWIIIFGGSGPPGALNSVELLNLRTNQSTSFGTLTNPTRNHVGGILNGFPFYCGGDSTIASPENSCFKFDQSWKKVILILYLLFQWMFSNIVNVQNEFNRKQCILLV